MATYRINYNQVVGKASDINNLSLEYEKEINKLEVILDDVNNHWSGPASNEFKTRLKLLIADMKATKYNMSSVSSTIKNVAKRIKSEDDKLAEIARNTSRGGGSGAIGYSKKSGGGGLR